MVVMPAASMDVEASCAICGAPPVPECPHEGERLNLAIDQAMARWAGVQRIREWVVIHARNQVISTFRDLKTLRYKQYVEHLQTLPCYALYQRYQGRPPLDPSMLHMLQAEIQRVNTLYKQGIDKDWQQSCLRYPQVLDYYFSLVEISFPDGRDASVVEPRFGALKETRRVKGRRDSVDEGSTKTHRKKDKRGRTPPPAPMAPRR